MEKTKEAVAEIFTDFLDRKGLRKTQERYAILDEIYSRPGHFNIESLYTYMSEKNYRVSKATLYNTVQLLLECDLIIIHKFKKEEAQYERAYNNPTHEHLICVRCGKVEEFTDSRMENIISHVEEKYEFSVHHHLLYVYGLCKACEMKQHKK